MIDIDFFKLYNDTRGHTAGDSCLRTIAGTLRKAANRTTDLVARYGGEEFAAVLSESDSQGAVKVARKARSGVEDLCIPHESSPVLPVVTVSIGIATMIPGPGDDPGELVKRADKALYYSKTSGRNRITMYDG